MRLLLINPNTTRGMTELVLATAQGVAAPTTVLSGATGRFGAAYISSRAASAVAGHAALDCYAEYGQTADVVGLACFGDPGLGGLRELAHQPVVGMAEAACLAAAHGGQRFAIVTGGERWGPMLEEFVAWLGLARQLAGVMTVAPTGADIARDPVAAEALLLDAVARAKRERGADVVILGGAGLAGLARKLTPHAACPLIDSVEALVKRAEFVGRNVSAKPVSGDYAATPVVGSIGLSAALSSKLGG